MPAIPPPEQFDKDSGNWEHYMDRINYFLLANHVKDMDKLPTFLSLLHKDVYSTLCQLISPVHPFTKTFSEIVEVLNKYFKPRILIPVERMHFIKRKQEADESIKDFIKSLRHLSTNCDYGDGIALDNRLCEQFIYGLRSSQIRSRLLTEEKISFSDSIRIALATEAAIKGAQELQNDSNISASSNVLFNRDNSRPSNHYKASTQSTKVKNSCVHCGYTSHISSDCKLKDAICHKCGKKGHISPVCKSKKTKLSSNSSSKRQSRPAHVVGVTSPNISDDDVLVDVSSFEVNYANNSAVSEPIMLEITINNVVHNLQLDTGAAVSIIPLSFYNKFLKDIKLVPTNVVLKTLREHIKPLGKVLVSATFKNKSADKLELIVIADPSVVLIGLTWINKLDIINQLSQNSILPISYSSPSDGSKELSSLMMKFSKLFSEKLGEFKETQVHLSLKEGVSPRFFKARLIPFALKEAVEAELLKLQTQKIISPIQHSEWAAPIVVIRKKDKSLRLCGDYKVGLNQALNIDQYPLPVIDEIFARLNGGVIFSKLDLTQAYQQLKMDEFSQKLLTINTHKGLFQVHRMPFGISPAPAIFQQKMDNLLLDLKGVVCYLDDILVSGTSLADHLINLEAVLSRLENSGITLNKQKCEFLKSQVEYLGHIIDKKGLQASPSKISSILQAPIPNDVSQLRSFLGLINYYRKFLPNLSTVLAPLNNLLRKDSKWCWNKAAQDAFSQIKNAITSTTVLTHFDPKLPIVLACDASSYGVGAVISHICPDSSERPIAFASRSLSPAEKNYSQLDKEALGILFGVKKFHQFLFGRHFTLFTDHKPLTRIFGASNQIPTLAAARLQRWALALSAYTYDIRYRCSKDHENADALSRSPISNSFQAIEEEEDESLLIANLDLFPVNDRMIAKETLKDPIFSQLLRFVRDGWPQPLTCSKELEPFRNRREELSLQDGCLLWGLRVLIPSSLRSLVLQDLHRHHTGMVRMKMIARSYFWWPNLDQDINTVASSCPECAFHSNTPAKAPIHPWTWPTKPWDRIHVDFAGPFMGNNFMVVVDAHSKWPEVILMKSTTTSSTISSLSEIFARFGLPPHLVSDNGTQFSSLEFDQFCKQHGIRHSFSSPYHPATNGQAERFIQTFKRTMKKKCKENLTIHDRVNQFLYSYRTTPHITTRQTPAFLFLGRELRTRLDLLRPSVRRIVKDHQEKMVFSRVDPNLTKAFSFGQRVIAMDYTGRNKWCEGVITRQLGPLTYHVKLPNGMVWKRHLDQLKPSTILQKLPKSEISVADNSIFPFEDSSAIDSSRPKTTPLVGPQITPTRLHQHRYPSRIRCPPKRLS